MQAAKSGRSHFQTLLPHGLYHHTVSDTFRSFSVDGCMRSKCSADLINFISTPKIRIMDEVFLVGGLWLGSKGHQGLQLLVGNIALLFLTRYLYITIDSACGLTPNSVYRSICKNDILWAESWRRTVFSISIQPYFFATSFNLSLAIYLDYPKMNFGPQ